MTLWNQGKGSSTKRDRDRVRERDRGSISIPLNSSFVAGPHFGIKGHFDRERGRQTDRWMDPSEEGLTQSKQKSGGCPNEIQGDRSG